ncbi:hypothetical protein ACIGB6_18555 [Paeniglutamicibacter gangotriensis]
MATMPNTMARGPSAKAMNPKNGIKEITAAAIPVIMANTVTPWVRGGM